MHLGHVRRGKSSTELVSWGSKVNENPRVSMPKISSTSLGDLKYVSRDSKMNRFMRIDGKTEIQMSVPLGYSASMAKNSPSRFMTRATEKYRSPCRTTKSSIDRDCMLVVLPAPRFESRAFLSVKANTKASARMDVIREVIITINDIMYEQTQTLSQSRT